MKIWYERTVRNFINVPCDWPDTRTYINQLINLEMALERLDGLFDAVSVAMHEDEINEAEYDIQRIYEFRNYIDKMLEGK